MQSIAPSPRPHRPRRTGRAAPRPSSPRARGARGALGSARGDPAASPAGASLPGELGRSRSWSPPRASEGSVSEKKNRQPAENPETTEPGQFYIALGFWRGRGEGVRDKSPSFLCFFFFSFSSIFYLFAFFFLFPPPGRSALSTYQTLKESVRSRCKIRFKFKKTFASPGGQAV